jgi:hypothetical protein
MSADYDRLFHSSGDAVQTADETPLIATPPHLRRPHLPADRAAAM